MKQTLRFAEYFSPLLRVSLQHDYFSDNRCRGISFEPTQQTARMLSRLGLLFKPLTDGGFLIMYNRHKEEFFARPGVLPEKLNFVLRKRDKGFINFSDLPFPDGGRAFYFTNRDCKARDKTEDFFLHNGAAYEGETQLGITSSRTSIVLPGQASFDQLTFTDHRHEAIVPRYLQPGLEKLPQHAHPVDFSDHEEGMITVTQKGKKAPVSSFISVRGAFPSDTIGFMELFLDDTPGQKFAVTHKGKITFRSYIIQFRSRSVYWKYIIVQRRTEHKLTGYKITNKQQTIGFTKAEMITLRNGKEVAVITSNDPLPLRQVPDDKYELSVRKNGKQTTMQINLPVPRAEMIKPDAEDTRRMYSNMYVYV